MLKDTYENEKSNMFQTRNIYGVREAQTEEEVRKSEDAKKFSRRLKLFCNAYYGAGSIAGYVAAEGISEIKSGDPTKIGYILVGIGILTYAILALLKNSVKENLTQLRENKILEIQSAKDANKEQEDTQARDFDKNLNIALNSYIGSFATTFAAFGAKSIIELPNPVTLENIPIGAVATALGVITGTVVTAITAEDAMNAVQENYDNIGKQGRER